MLAWHCSEVILTRLAELPRSPLKYTSLLLLSCDENDATDLVLLRVTVFLALAAPRRLVFTNPRCGVRCGIPACAYPSVSALSLSHRSHPRNCTETSAW